MSFTCIAVANQMGSDSPPLPVPVHQKCWVNSQRGGYERVYAAGRFIINGKWHESLPEETSCYLCHEII